MTKTTEHLKLPHTIWELPKELLSWEEKHLLSFFWWCGSNGCYCWNNNLAERFGVSPRTVRRWLTKLEKSGLIYIGQRKGRNRTIYPKKPPDNLIEHLLANL